MRVRREKKELQFRSLSFQERLSRLEEELERLKRETQETIMVTQNITATLVEGKGIKFRDCDGSVVLFREDGTEVALFTDKTAVVSGSLILTAYDPVTGDRIGQFGIDQAGQFFVTQFIPDGELLTLVCDKDGLLIRDQNGNLGRLEVDTNGFVKFIPV